MRCFAHKATFSLETKLEGDSYHFCQIGLLESTPLFLKINIIKENGVIGSHQRTQYICVHFCSYQQQQQGGGWKLPGLCPE